MYQIGDDWKLCFSKNVNRIRQL